MSSDAETLAVNFWFTGVCKQLVNACPSALPYYARAMMRELLVQKRAARRAAGIATARKMLEEEFPDLWSAMQPLHEGTDDESIRTAMDRSPGTRQRAAFALFTGRELASCCGNSVGATSPRLASHRGHERSSERVDGEGKGRDGGSGSAAGSETRSGSHAGSDAGSDAGSHAAGSESGSDAQSGGNNHVGPAAKGGHSPGESKCLAKRSVSRQSFHNNKRLGSGHSGSPRKRGRPRESARQQAAPRSSKRLRASERLKAGAADHDMEGSSLATRLAMLRVLPIQAMAQVVATVIIVCPALWVRTLQGMDELTADIWTHRMEAADTRHGVAWMEPFYDTAFRGAGVAFAGERLVMLTEECSSRVLSDMLRDMFGVTNVATD